MTKVVTPSSYSYLWRTDLPAAIQDLADAGFQQTEIMAALPHIDLWRDGGDLASQLSAVCERTGLQIAGLNPPGLDINIGSPDASMRDWSIRTYVEVGQLAADVGARYLVVHPGRRHVLVPAPAAAAREWVIDAVGVIAEELAATGLRVLFENTPTGLLDTAEECVDVVRHLGADTVGLVYDVANGYMVEDPADGLRTVAEFVEVVHLSDTSADRWQHAPVGSGDVDFGALARAAADVGFEGETVLETVHPGDIAEGLRLDRTRLARAGWTL